MGLLEDYEQAVAEEARAAATLERARARAQALRKRVTTALEQAQRNPELPLGENSNPAFAPVPVPTPALASPAIPDVVTSAALVGALIGASTGMREVARYLLERGREADVDTIAREMNISYDAARIRCARATRAGVIRRVGHGIYAAMRVEDAP